MLGENPSFVFALLIVIGIAAPVSAQLHRGSWEYLGSSHVDGTADHDKIQCHGSDTFRALQLRVNGAAVRFDHIVIVYGNNAKQSLPVNSVISSGGKSRNLDLPGDRRDIKYVELWYEKGKWANKPEVRLYGLP